MFITKPGRISPNVFFVGNEMLCNYLVIGKKQSILLDAGMTLSAPILEKQIKHHLNHSHQLKGIWLTHSHYDHLGSVPYLIKKFPRIEIAAHPVAKQVLEKPRSIQLIAALNEESERRYASEIKLPKEAIFERFTINKLLKDNEIFELENGVTIQTIYTPGHTKDSIAFYSLPDNVLYGGDGLGVPTPTGFIQATFLSDYDDYLNSLAKLQALEIETLALPHGGVIQGTTDVENHFSRSIEETIRLRKQIEKYLNRFDGDVERVTAQIDSEDYERHQIMQPKEAFLINLKAMVTRTKKDRLS